jgi:hypothetical protein
LANSAVANVGFCVTSLVFFFAVKARIMQASSHD